MINVWIRCGFYVLVICLRLFSVRGEKPGMNVQLTEIEIKGLCLKSREIFLSQPILLELEAPLKICGEYKFLWVFLTNTHTFECSLPLSKRWNCIFKRLCHCWTLITSLQKYYVKVFCWMLANYPLLTTFFDFYFKIRMHLCNRHFW